MHGRKIESWLPAIAAVLTMAVIAGCAGSSGEQQVLKKYFDASRLRDNRTLANIASVSFRPQEEGIVQSFSVVTVAEQRRTPLRVRELNQAYEQAKKEDEEFSKRKNEYQDANLEALDRVLRAERENTRLRGRDLKVQEEWAKWREEMAASAKKVSEAQEALSHERTIAELSVFSPEKPVDVAQYDGDVISKDITINARIRTPEDQNVEKQLVVTIHRAELRGGPAGEVNGRWVITSITETGS